VSKDVPFERIRAAVACGLVLMGENRVQEAASKAPHVAGARWHLVGRLQSNKVRPALELFEGIQSVDTLDLAGRIDRLLADVTRPRYPVHLQVNVDDDAAKAGFAPDDLDAQLPRLLALERLDVRGLMTVGRLVPDPEAARPTFVRLRELSERLREREPSLGPDLSMGMTDDFEVAVEEGATIVRIGRAIFGERHHH
jgi:PLP dependent protein